jgi:O-methyltransferase
MLPELKCYADLAYSNQDTIQNTYDLTARVIQNGIEGDLVECGVAAGSQIGVMGHACKKLGSRKRIYAYDSYQGIPLAGPNDTDQPGIGPVDPNRPLPKNTRELLVTSGITAHSLDQVQGNIRRWGLNYNQYTFKKGWFQDTVPGNDIEKIALLRLDGDLYESTQVCLEHLHHKVQKGGFVIIDDYALDGARKAVHEFFEKNNLSYEIIPVDPSRREVHWYEVK